MRWIEFFASWALVIILASALLPACGANEASMRHSCQNNLKQMGLVCKMFAGENNGRWPARDPKPGRWLPAMDAIHPEYLTDLSILQCPDSPFSTENAFRLMTTTEHPFAQLGEMHPDCVSSRFYVYTGYTIWSDEQALALYGAYNENRDLILARQSLRLNVPRWENSDRVANPGTSGIPIMWDRPYMDTSIMSHKWPLGGNVLHMDGHVEFVPYNENNTSNFFPMTFVSAMSFHDDDSQLSCDCAPY